MSETFDAQAWLGGKSDNRRFVLAFFIGLVLEAGVLAVLLPVMTHQRPPPAQTQSVVKLSIMAPAPPAPPAPPPPKPVVTPPKQVTPPPVLPPPPPLPLAPPLPPPPPIPVAPNRPVFHRPPRPRHVTPPRVQPPPVVAQTPPAPTPAPPTPPPAAAPAAPSAGELDLFQAAMRRAVQAAAVNPAAAQMAHEAGVVRVEFTYANGVASCIEVVGSSGFPILDDAAEDAVRNAAYPPQPPDFAGRADIIVVDVIFRAAVESVDGD